MMKTMVPQYFPRILHLREPCTKPSKIEGRSAAQQPRSNNRTRKRKVHNRQYFDRLRTKSFVKNLGGQPLLQPEDCDVKWPRRIFTLLSCPHSNKLPSHSSFRSRMFYMLNKMLLDRDTNKCFDKDITEYLDKYQNKHINKYKDKLINLNKHENSTKTRYFKKYILQPLPQVQPSHHSHAILTLPQHRLHAAPTPPPHHSNLRSRSAHTAPTQPPRSLHAAPTPPLRSPSAAATPPPRRLHTTATPTQRHRKRAAALTQSPPRCTQLSRRSYAGRLSPSCRLNTVHTPLQLRRNAALTPLHAALTPMHAALTQPSRRPHATARRCSDPPPSPPLLPKIHLMQGNPHRSNAAVASACRCQQFLGGWYGPVGRNVCTAQEAYVCAE